MVLYDFLAPAYDPILESIYRPFRVRAFDFLPSRGVDSVLDLACGTGQNFPFLAQKCGAKVKIVGVDISSGMLRFAEKQAACLSLPAASLLHLDATQVSPWQLEAQTGQASVDLITCTFGLTSMRDWKPAFAAAWELLRPGGGFFLLDVDGQQRNLHARVVEWATRSDFSQKVWQPLQNEASDFRMDYIEPSAHLFGGRLFVAYGEKPSSTTKPPSCLS